ncbi:calcium-binding protein [Aestuariicoccus sp. MJ-SS9]|uniref:calcium-binding protein n=1 Tax=Aestuariicoccus sp. MJ-SS9 TaxID=3079855 RepID=UPI002910B33D|nr:calcium-binding protein [Aestuariicoccus sp. MJ-SS9]MDU8912149.1 calcium-binding protein [Aestuariicoccus sp. MJ-SS9]
MENAYSFSFDAAGIVTGIFEVEEDGTLDPKTPDADESYELIDGFVVEIDSGPFPEWEVYAEDPETGYWFEVADGDGVFDPAVLGGLTDVTVPPVEDDEEEEGEDIDAYVFEFADDGTVTAVFEVGPGGALEPEEIDPDESYALIDGFVVETETGLTPEWEVYAKDPETGYWYEVADGDGVFDPAVLDGLAGVTVPPVWDDEEEDDSGDDEEDDGDDSEDDEEDDGEEDDGGDPDAYHFEFDDTAAVIAVSEVEDDGTLDPEEIEDDESYTLIEGFVLKTEHGHGAPEWSVYAKDPDTDHWYEVAEGYGTFVPALLQELPAQVSAEVMAHYVAAHDISYHWGEEGDDSLEGDAGDDHMGAGAGNDHAHGGGGNDVMGGGLGNDTMSGDAGDDVIGCGLGDDSADGGDGEDVVNGGAGDDTMSGGTGDDTMGASFGSDSVDGGDGHDNMGGGAGTDDIACGEGDDHAGGGEGDDTINGDAGDDFLAGGGRDDLIDGGTGNDTINGGKGNDTMTGGEGADVFVFRHFNDGEVDLITDFEDGIDLLRLKDVETEDGQSDFEALTITDTAAGAQIVNDGHTIVLEGVAEADLGAEDFLFV